MKREGSGVIIPWDDVTQSGRGTGDPMETKSLLVGGVGNVVEDCVEFLHAFLTHAVMYGDQDLVPVVNFVDTE